MDYNKQQEIKNIMFQLVGSKPQVVNTVMMGYIFGDYGSNEHYMTDELGVLYDEMYNEHYNILVFAPLLSWYDPTTSKRVVLTDESVKHIAINALPLIEYVNQSGLILEDTTGYIRIYVNYVLDEHRAIFEGFGGHVEDNPYPTTIQIDAMLVAELNAFKEEHMLEIEGWDTMLKAQKQATLKYIIYGIETA